MPDGDDVNVSAGNTIDNHIRPDSHQMGGGKSIAIPRQEPAPDHVERHHPLRDRISQPLVHCSEIGSFVASFAPGKGLFFHEIGFSAALSGNKFRPNLRTAIVYIGRRRGHTMNDTEAIRSQYKPEWIVTLFVGESAPISGDFFYKGNSALTRHMRTAMEAAGLASNADFLATFKSLGWYLDDLVLDPINNLTPTLRKARHREWQENLRERIAAYRPRAVVSLLYAIRDIVEVAAARGAKDSRTYAVHFPGNGQQKAFSADMARILPELPTLPQIRAMAREAADGLTRLRDSINAPPLGWEEIKKMRDEGRR